MEPQVSLPRSQQLPVVTIFSQIKSVHTLPPYFFNPFEYRPPIYA
jgi:hypothetical protein